MCFWCFFGLGFFVCLFVFRALARFSFFFFFALSKAEPGIPALTGTPASHRTLAGACQRNGVGGFIVQSITSKPRSQRQTPHCSTPSWPATLRKTAHSQPRLSCYLRCQPSCFFFVTEVSHLGTGKNGTATPLLCPVFWTASAPHAPKQLGHAGVFSMSVCLRVPLLAFLHTPNLARTSPLLLSQHARGDVLLATPTCNTNNSTARGSR